MGQKQPLRAGPPGAGQTAPAPAPPLIANLQVLRAWCALAIILFHTLSTAREYGFRSPVLGALSGWGFQGVDIFFLISGFVMVLTQARKQRGRGAFLIERLVRVAPTYWLLTGFVFALTLAVPKLFRSLSADPLWFFQSMSFSNLLWKDGENFPLIYVGWTLEYEMLFYLVFAASLGLDGWGKRLASQALLFGLIWWGFTTSIIMEFLIGELCALYYLSGRTIARPRLFLIAGLIGLALPVLVWPDGTRVMTLFRFALFGVPAAGVLFWALYARQSGNRVLLAIGNASYSIYLIQALSISFFCKLFVKLLPATPPILVAFVTIAGTVLIGLVFFHLIERPLIKGLRRGLAKWRAGQSAAQAGGRATD